MTEAVVAGSLTVAILNAVAGAWGSWLWYRGEVLPRGAAAGPAVDERGGRAPARVFWVMLRIGQGSALALVLAVGSLAAAGKYSTENLFYLYSLLPLAIAFVAEQLRAASAQTILDQRGLEDAQAVGGLAPAEQVAVVAAIVRREVGVMALSALVVVFLALRAASTAHGF